MELLDFVTSEFGAEAAASLKRIRTGGDNNKKGAGFEAFFAVAKICEIAANQPVLDDYIISAQELAFVDDLCICERSVLHNINRHKANYQAKNSSGTAADWDADMERRFRWQHNIDKNVHQFQSNSQVLVVSCPEKQAANDDKIPSDLKGICFSEFFPHQNSSTKLVISHQSLRNHLETLCDSKDLSVIDTAFRLVLAAWSANDYPRSVGDIIGAAKAMAKPDIFAGFVPERRSVPDWLYRKCIVFDGFEARVEFGRFVVSYNGFEVSLGPELGEPEPNVLEALIDPSDFVQFLVSRARTGLTLTNNDSRE